GFLYLMGASSAGYLGGKLARKPGPVIDSIIAQEGSIILKIVGRCLSRDASFLIDDLPVTVNLKDSGLQAAAAAAPAPTTDAELIVVRKDESSSDPGTLASELRLTLRDPAAWAARNGQSAGLLAPNPPPDVDPNRRLTIVNPDGQKAVWTFRVARQT